MTLTAEYIARQITPPGKSAKRGTEDNWNTWCPVHPDENPSFSIKINEHGYPIGHCHRGCSQERIQEYFKREKLWPEPNGNGKGSGNGNGKAAGSKPKLTHIADYDYSDALGVVRHRSTKLINNETEKKTFVQFRRSEDGSFVKGLAETKLYIYKYPQVIEAGKEGEPVFIQEGEKDCETLLEWFNGAFYTTTNPMGALKWTDDYTQMLKLAGVKAVYILPDNDDVGEKHAQQVAQSCHAANIETYILRLTDLPRKGDLTDWKNAGHTLEEFCDLVADCKSWQPPSNNVVANQAVGDRQLDLARATISSIGAENLKFIGGRFFRYTGRVWELCDDHTIKQCIISVYESNELAHKVTQNALNSVLGLIKTECIDSDDVFNNASCRTICCLNGELELGGTGWKLGPHERTNYRLSMLPVAFDPSARPPLWFKFLSEIFERDEDREEKIYVLQQFFGYSLCTHCDFERFLLQIGDGSNGKSTVSNVATALLGEGNVSAVDPTQFENRFQLAYLRGKLANIVTEMRQNQDISDARLKSLVSGEAVTAEHKMCPPFTFRPCAKHWFSSNHLPSTRDFSPAFFRRAIVLEYNECFDKSANPNARDGDPNLFSKLRQELPGIFNWALDGLAELTEHGRFFEPASSAAIKKNWLLENDQMARFIDEVCKVGVSESCSCNLLYSIYENWAKTTGIVKPYKQNGFSRQLKRFGVKPHREPRARMHDGIDVDYSKLESLSEGD